MKNPIPATIRGASLALVAAFAAFLPGLARAQSPPAAAPIGAAGTPVITPDWRAALLAEGRSPSAFGGVEPAPEGVALVTKQQPEHVYSLQAQLPNEIPLTQGDTLLIRFAGRSRLADRDTGVTKIKVSFQKASPDWDSSYTGEVGLGSSWQRFDIPFKCKRNFAKSEAMLQVTFGYPAQVAEIADVQVLRFGPEVAVASLPKTERHADPVSPEQLKQEVDRIAGLRRQLAEVTDPSPAHGATLNVATTGSAQGDGSAQHPFATITQALRSVQPGDTIVVAAGEYREPGGVSIRRSGRPDAWIKIKAAPGARPKIVTSGWSGFELRGGIAYIEIDGFELQWVPPAPAAPGQTPAKVYGVGVAPMYASHHIRVLNNVIHGYGTGGICSLDCDYMHVEGNTIYDCAKTSPYGGSAISLCRAFNFDEYPGYHNVVSRNICYDNELRVSVLELSGGNGKALTDGNGIIIDVFKRSRKNPLKPHGEDRDGPLEPYRGRTLVENNLIYNNGGRGIHIFRSEKVDVINNTCYRNQKTPDINAGELTAIEAGEVTFFNNVAYGRPEKRGNTQDGSRRILWSHNLFFSADDVLLHEGVMGKDPDFVAAALDAHPDGFELKPDSPAIGKGLSEVAPLDDLNGKRRPKGMPVDLGAFQSASK